MEAEHPLLNSCVLGHLFDYLNFSTLKVCRLVCTTWNSVAGSGFRNRATTRILFDADLVKFNQTINESYEATSKCMKNLVAFEYDPIIRSDICQNLLRKYKSSIKSFELILFSPALNQGLVDALTALPALEELSVHNAFSSSDTPLKVKQFGKLKSLCLSSHTKTNDKSEIEDECFIRLVQACEKTLRKLVITELKIPRFYSAIFENANLTQLTHLVLGSGYSEFQYNKVPVDLLKISLRLHCPNLQRFECYFGKSVSAGDISDVMACLRTAQEIKLHQQFQFLEPTSLITVPSLPNLRKLSLKIKFGGDMGQFASCTPGLKKLDLYPAQYNSCGWKVMRCLEELNLGHYYHTYWQEHFDLTELNFPRLTKLTAELCAGSGKLIFDQFKNLKELTVTRGSKFCDEDVTGIDFEILNSADSGCEIKRTRPYIGDLKHLQVLHLDGRYFTNDSIRFGICDVDSLTNLTIRFPEEKVTRVFLDTRPKELRKTHILPGTYSFDLEPLMLPRVRQLVKLSIKTLWNAPSPVHDAQVEAMKALRPDFSFWILEDKK